MKYIKKTGNLNIDQTINEFKKLSRKEVLIGFFGERDSQLLTIVRANEFGATIKPQNGEWLWIPNLPVTKGKQPSEIQGMFIPKGKHVAVINKKGKHNSPDLGTDPNDTADNPLTICFYLMKNVTIPARPFIRTAFEKNKGKYSRIAKNGVKAILSGKASAKDVLNRLGVVATADIQKSAIMWKLPKNQPVTIANKKGTDNPLINLGMNGGMISKITYMIIDI